MRLSRALQEKQMDVRLRDKLMSEGKLTKKQVEEITKALPDDQTRATLTHEGDRGDSLRNSQ